MAIGDRIYIADKTTLDEVNTKCTTIQTNTNNLNSRLTSTRAGYLDYLANSTYGLNAIKNAINTVDNNVDSIKTYTTTNNTGSKTGVLSQKSSYIINMLENSTYGLNAIKNNTNTIINNNKLFGQIQPTSGNYTCVLLNKEVKTFRTITTTECVYSFYPIYNCSLLLTATAHSDSHDSSTSGNACIAISTIPPQSIEDNQKTVLEWSQESDYTTKSTTYEFQAGEHYYIYFYRRKIYNVGGEVYCNNIKLSGNFI